MQWVVSIPILLLLSALALLRDHSRLSFTSALGDIAVLGGTLVVAVGALQVSRDAPLSSSSAPLSWASPSTLPLSFGIIAVLYCTQFLTLPIEASMRHPEDYDTAIWNVFGVTTLVNLAFALL